VFVLASFAAAQSGTWTNVQPPASPPYRATEGISFEPASGLVVAYGGATSSAATTVLNETWGFDGSTWTQLFPVGDPGPRFNTHLARSPTPGRVVLFGGATAVFVVEGTTWEFDPQSVTWTNMTPAGPSPSPRQLATTVYDSTRGRTVLFGGTSGTGSFFYGDTWEWNGTTWTNVTPVAGPGPVPRAWHSMTFDSARGRTVLFGGYNGAQLGDTWEWDGTQWTQVMTPVSPSPRSSGAIAYDSVTQRVVLFAGSQGWPIGLNDVWQYDGTNWYPVSTPGTIPPPQYLQGMVEDPVSGGILVYGAFGDGWVPLNDTWLYVPMVVPATFSTFGAGCAGTAGVPALAAAPGQLPWIGSTLTLEFTNLPSTVLSPVIASLGFSRTMWGSLPLPYPLAGFGMPGCFVFIAATFSRNLANAAGMATWPIAVPNNLGLVGTQFFVQGLVFDFGVNQFNAVVTNAGAGVVGVR